MDMKVTKWEKSIADRCVERVEKGYVPVNLHHVKVVDRAFQLGEWDDFASKINNAIMRRRR